MPIKVDEYNQVCVVTIEGDLASDTCPVFRNTIEDSINKNHVEFVLDMEKCGFMDSEGLEALLWAKRRAEDLSGQIKLVGLDENCRKILEITRLDHRFACEKDLNEALKMMR